MCAEPASGQDCVTPELRARLATAEDTASFGARLAQVLRAGDLLVLTGELGAGKTTLTQGIAEGLGVRGPITSPTFVIARTHPSLVGGPHLVHVDAYRLSGREQMADLDLELALEDSVVVVEWGAGMVEDLSNDRLAISLHGLAERELGMAAVGPRWREVFGQLRALAG